MIIALVAVSLVATMTRTLANQTLTENVPLVGEAPALSLHDTQDL